MDEKSTFLFSLDGKVQQLLTGIQSTDECQQLQAVMELCQVVWSLTLTMLFSSSAVGEHFSECEHA